MRTKLNHLTIIITLTISLGCTTLFTGCGGSSKPVLSSEDSAAFTAAIAKYCEQKGMGMAVDKFVKADIKGDTATLVCKMKLAEGSGPRIRWTISMERKDNKWEMTGFTR